MVNTILFDIHKNYIVTYNSRVYAVISIFQRSLLLAERAFYAAEPRFRRKVKGTGSFSTCTYVVVSILVREFGERNGLVKLDTDVIPM